MVCIYHHCHHNDVVQLYSLQCRSCCPVVKGKTDLGRHIHMSQVPLPLCTQQVLDYRLIYSVDLSGRGVNSHHCYFRMDSGMAAVAAGGICVCRMDDVLCCGLLPGLCLLMYEKKKLRSTTVSMCKSPT